MCCEYQVCAAHTSLLPPLAYLVFPTSCFLRVASDLRLRAVSSIPTRADLDWRAAAAMARDVRHAHVDDPPHRVRGPAGLAALGFRRAARDAAHILRHARCVRSTPLRPIPRPLGFQPALLPSALRAHARSVRMRSASARAHRAHASCSPRGLRIRTTPPAAAMHCAMELGHFSLIASAALCVFLPADAWSLLQMALPRAQCLQLLPQPAARSQQHTARSQQHTARSQLPPQPASTGGPAAAPPNPDTAAAAAADSSSGPARGGMALLASRLRAVLSAALLFIVVAVRRWSRICAIHQPRLPPLPLVPLLLTPRRLTNRAHLLTWTLTNHDSRAQVSLDSIDPRLVDKLEDPAHQPSPLERLAGFGRDIGLPARADSACAGLDPSTTGFKTAVPPSAICAPAYC